MYSLLIVEDEKLIRKWLRYSVDFEQVGIQVIGEAINGREGAKLILETKPDIVLTDISMPEMTAFEMFEATRTMSYVKIIVSGFNDFENAKLAMQYGAVDFITKPIDKQELLKTLEKIVSHLSLTTTAATPLPIQARQLLAKKIPVLDDCTREVIQWIQEYYASDATVADLSHELGYSESYIYKQFKQQMNQTVNQYKTEFRIKKAIEMMQENPTLHLYEIAQEVGWSDYNYFNQIFKKYIGMTASDLKRQLDI